VTRRAGFTLPKVPSAARAVLGNVPHEDGFTLIELAIVLLVIGLTFTLVIPQFRARTDADLKRASLKLAAALEYTFSQSIFRRQTFRMQYDLDGSRYWVDRFVDPLVPGHVGKPQAAASASGASEEDAVEAPDDPEEAPAGQPYYVVDRKVLAEAVELPEGVRIDDVTTQYLDTITEGKAFTHFFPDGYAEPTVIHLTSRSNKSEYTLVLTPLSGKVKVYPRREEFEVDMKEGR
jgi:prepilin-type N-terminal cleavage/methylation domain-containing protein